MCTHACPGDLDNFDTLPMEEGVAQEVLRASQVEQSQLEADQGMEAITDAATPGLSLGTTFQLGDEGCANGFRGAASE